MTAGDVVPELGEAIGEERLGPVGLCDDHPLSTSLGFGHREQQIGRGLPLGDEIDGSAGQLGQLPGGRGPDGGEAQAG